MKIRELRTTVSPYLSSENIDRLWRRKGHGTSASAACSWRCSPTDGIARDRRVPGGLCGASGGHGRTSEGSRITHSRSRPLRAWTSSATKIYAETGMAHLGTQGLSWALAGLDMAMWDVVGKVCGQPPTPHLGQRVAHRV